MIFSPSWTTTAETTTPLCALHKWSGRRSKTFVRKRAEQAFRRRPKKDGRTGPRAGRPAAWRLSGGPRVAATRAGDAATRFVGVRPSRRPDRVWTVVGHTSRRRRFRRLIRSRRGFRPSRRRHTRCVDLNKHNDDFYSGRRFSTCGGGGG